MQARKSANICARSEPHADGNREMTLVDLFFFDASVGRNEEAKEQGTNAHAQHMGRHPKERNVPPPETNSYHQIRVGISYFLVYTAHPHAHRRT